MQGSQRGNAFHPPHMERAMAEKPLLTWDVVIACRPCTTGSCLRQLRRKRSAKLIFLADAGRDKRLLFYRSCTLCCEVLRQNE